MLNQKKVDQLMALIQEWTETPLEEGEEDETFAEWLAKKRPSLVETLDLMVARAQARKAGNLGAEPAE